MGKSSIEWTGATWNPIRARNIETGQVGTHCVKVSPGCLNCYAETHNGRNLPAGSSGLPYTAAGAARAEYFIDSKMLAEPLRRRKPEVYFPCSMTDLFMYPVQMIAALFGVMAACPQHTFQVLTKRPENAARFFDWCAQRGEHGASLFPADPLDWRIRQMLRVTAQRAGADVPQNHGGPWPLSNAWMGVSVEDRKHGLPRIDILRQIPTALRFLSIEPLLEDLGEVNLDGIGWVIVGGESGHTARPFDVAWARSIILQCRAAGVPVFLKQVGAYPFDSSWFERTYQRRPTCRADVDFSALHFESRKGGDPSEWPDDLRVREMPAVARG